MAQHPLPGTPDSTVVQAPRAAGDTSAWSGSTAGCPRHESVGTRYLQRLAMWFFAQSQSTFQFVVPASRLASSVPVDQCLDSRPAGDCQKSDCRRSGLSGHGREPDGPARRTAVHQEAACSESARAQPSEAPVNSASPLRYTRRYPTRSPSMAHGSSNPSVATW